MLLVQGTKYDRAWSTLFCSAWLILLCGCSGSYLAVEREYVDRSHLASSYVESPDPLQKNPPTGQELTIKWRLPPEESKRNLKLVLHVLYCDYSQETFYYPINRRKGTLTCSLVSEEYLQRRGLLTYRVEIVDLDGLILQEWRHLLWTELITVEEPDMKLKD